MFEDESCRVVYDSLSGLSKIRVCIRGGCKQPKRGSHIVIIRSEKKGASFFE